MIKVTANNSIKSTTYYMSPSGLWYSLGQNALVLNLWRIYPPNPAQTLGFIDV
jgi:hypothetical protein